MREEILRRILMSKRLLLGAARPSGDVDAMSVARDLLTSHDAVELALSAIADHVGATLGPKDKTYALDYAAAIQETVGTLPGRDFVKALNQARVNFKHVGNLPNVQQWHRVVENSWRWINEWCNQLLQVSLYELDDAALIADQRIRDGYYAAKAKLSEGLLKDALEELARLLYLALSRLPGIFRPTFGTANNHYALLLLGFGVDAGKFLSLQKFLPAVSEDKDSGELAVHWNEREYGHRGNWTAYNVRFCLLTFLDTVLRIQDAQWYPSPIELEFVFDDVITARQDGVQLYVEGPPEGEGLLARRGNLLPLRTMRAGESIRGRLLKADHGISPLLGIFQEAGAPKYLRFRPNGEEIFTVYFVREAEITLSQAPRNDEFVRQYFPHLYEG